MTSAYYRQKHGPVKRGNRRIFPDWLMVRTGELSAALTHVGGFGEYVDAHRAVFGTPLGPEEADKALFNSETRPTIFLGRSDRNMIRREMQNYLSMGQGYKDMLFAKAARLTALKKEIKAMDLEFSNVMAGP